MEMPSPINLLKKYQREVYDDRARFICWIAGRQIGKSFTGAGKVVEWAHEKRRSDVVIASPSERQSIEAIEKCKDWARAFDYAIKEETEERDAPEAIIKSKTIIFPNGSKIIAVPGKPEAVRGYTANMWLDEFAFFENPDATWKAVSGVISNELRGKKKMLITSTPNGRSGRGRRFWEIVTAHGKIDPNAAAKYAAGIWSVYRTPITTAAPFLGTNVEELREAINNDEAWQQEFLCQFIDASTVLLPYDLLARCESEEATTDAAEILSDKSGEWYGGLDFGRSHDPSRLVLAKQIGETRYAVRGMVTCREENTVRQFEIFRPYLERCERVCIDYTGPGVGFGDICANELGGAKTALMQGWEKCELCFFSQPFKCEIFPKLKTRMDAGDMLIPADVEFREDCHEMQDRVTNGRHTYEARRTAEGHSDICTALALCNRACESSSGAACEPPENPVEEDFKYKRGWL